MQASAAHVFVGDLEALELEDGDAHHLRHALRLRAGEVVTAADGAGRWRSCRFAPSGLVADGPIGFEPALTPPITIGFAPVKGQRPEWAVQKMVELGVDRIVPLRAARSVVRWDDDRVTSALTRWRRVAREASMQSRRVRLPGIDEPRSVADLVAAGAALAHPAGAPPTLGRPTVLIGPEGGWADDELAGSETVGLGPMILRTETAAVSAAALLAGLRSGLVADLGPSAS